MNQMVKTQDVGGLIFQPAETLNRRVIDAEQEAKDLRKQRSRAVMMAVMASVALLTLAIGAFFVVADANARAEKAEAELQKVEDETDEIVKEASRLREEALNRESIARRQLNGLNAYTDILNAKITAQQSFDELDHYRQTWAGRPTTGLDLSKSLNFRLADWTVGGITRDNWSGTVADAYLRDAQAYRSAIQVFEDWTVRGGQRAAPPKCVTPNPISPSPRDCPDPNR